MTVPNNVVIAEMAKDLSYIKQEVIEIKSNLNAGYPTRKEVDMRIQPLEKLVYGMVGLILVGVIGALVTLVLK